MTDILDEVLNDHNEAKKLNYFKKALPVVIAFTIIIVVGMLVNNWRNDNRTENNKKTGDALIKVLAEVDKDKKFVLESLAGLVKSNSNKVSDLAAIEQAQIHINDKKYSAAKDLLVSFISTNHDIISSSYARLVWLSITIDEAKVSVQDKARMEEYLKYFNQEDRPFFGTASIIKALWYAKNSQKELAMDAVGRVIAAKDVSELVKEQARALRTNLEIE